MRLDLLVCISSCLALCYEKSSTMKIRLLTDVMPVPFTKPSGQQGGLLLFFPSTLELEHQGVTNNCLDFAFTSSLLSDCDEYRGNGSVPTA